MTTTLAFHWPCPTQRRSRDLINATLAFHWPYPTQRRSRDLMNTTLAFHWPCPTQRRSRDIMTTTLAFHWPYPKQRRSCCLPGVCCVLVICFVKTSKYESMFLSTDVWGRYPSYAWQHDRWCRSDAPGYQAEAVV